jgi:hypothetical protein
MDSLHQIETVILLLIAVLALTAVVRKLVIIHPTLLGIGDLVLGLILGLPTIRLAPDTESANSGSQSEIAGLKEIWRLEVNHAAGW